MVVPGPDDDLSLDDFKHMRVGHISLGRFCDTVVELLVAQIESHGTLPHRWSWKSRDHFVTKYGDLGRILWAKTASYHLLMVDGVHVFRAWTDSPKSCIVDINESLAILLTSRYEVSEIPQSCFKKTKPMTKRYKVKSLDDAVELCNVVKNLYRM